MGITVGVITTYSKCLTRTPPRPLLLLHRRGPGEPAAGRLRDELPAPPGRGVHFFFQEKVHRVCRDHHHEFCRVSTQRSRAVNVGRRENSDETFRDVKTTSHLLIK